LPTFAAARRIAFVIFFCTHFIEGYQMSGQGSTGNVLCALASFIYPGLGQLFQGRILAGALFFFMATALWFVLLGWVMHIWATVDAALFRA
jgi:TM2 domain-containing membrane protein YozV